MDIDVLFWWVGYFSTALFALILFLFIVLLSIWIAEMIKDALCKYAQVAKLAKGWAEWMRWQRMYAKRKST